MTLIYILYDKNIYSLENKEDIDDFVDISFVDNDLHYNISYVYFMLYALANRCNINIKSTPQQINNFTEDYLGLSINTKKSNCNIQQNI